VAPGIHLGRLEGFPENRPMLVQKPPEFHRRRDHRDHHHHFEQTEPSTYHLRTPRKGMSRIPEWQGRMGQHEKKAFFSSQGYVTDSRMAGRTDLARKLRVAYHLNMRILITGDRHWRCDDLAEQVLNRLLARYGPDLVIIHGGAAGIDQSFSVAGEALGLDVEPHLADWKGLGNVAGPARNREMVEAGADLCIALHRTLATSKGTKDCIRQALAAGIPVYLIEDDRAIPRRVQADDPRLAHA
jgi:hypothetical protein